MSEFLPPDAMTLQAAGQALSRSLEAYERGVQETDRTFYDTFDGLLHQAGLSVVHESGRLMALEQSSGEELASLASAQPIEPLFANQLDPGPLRDVLGPIVEQRALLPLAHVHCRARGFGILDGHLKTVVRAMLEEPMLVEPSSSTVPLRPRLRVAAVPGYDHALARVQHALEHELGFRAADQLLVDEAVRAAGGIPGGISAKVEVPLSFEQRSDAAAAAVLSRLREVIEANLPGAIAALDSEFLHDLRVSVRRSRTVQRQLKSVFAPVDLAGFRSEFQWLQQATGEARDLDVHVLEFDALRRLVPKAMRSHLDPLLEVLRERRALAHGEMVGALRSARTEHLLADWELLLSELVELPDGDRPGASRPIGELAGERIAKVYRRIVKMGSSIEPDSPAERYHELRKAGKELRYLLELFAVPLYPSEVVEPAVKALKGIQHVLGRHQDREVQIATLRSLAEPVSALPGGPRALMAMGVIVERLGEDERAARHEFGRRFDAFASKAQRRQIKGTFP
ncbi:MAG: CHAD domain-containing protein [Solirubrobacterales bacterium]|nr:CHAD domain-containing protein [Solirubrobacterales bacterium]